MKNFERQQKLDRQKQDHAAKMAELDEEIRQVKEQAMEAQLSKDMKNALEQKQHDLENAKIHATQQLKFSRMPANAESSPPRAKSSLPQRHKPSVSPPPSVAPVESRLNPIFKTNRYCRQLKRSGSDGRNKITPQTTRLTH